MLFGGKNLKRGEKGRKKVRKRKVYSNVESKYVQYFLKG
jgi:hypothetical protein